MLNLFSKLSLLVGIWICAECLGISLLFLLFTSGFDFGGVSEKSA